MVVLSSCTNIESPPLSCQPVALRLDQNGSGLGSTSLVFIEQMDPEDVAAQGGSR
jgi:hypothetical protein